MAILSFGDVAHVGDITPNIDLIGSASFIVKVANDGTRRFIFEDRSAITDHGSGAVVTSYFDGGIIVSGFSNEVNRLFNDIREGTIDRGKDYFLGFVDEARRGHPEFKPLSPPAPTTTASAAYSASTRSAIWTRTRPPPSGSPIRTRPASTRLTMS